MSEPTGPALGDVEPFGVLLERLIRLKKHDDGRPYTVAEVAEEVSISKSHLYGLIKGSNEPSLRLTQLLATNLGVELEYFGTSERAREIQSQYALLARLSRQGISDLAFRASELSPNALSTVLDFIDFQASRDSENHTSG
ncbi:helix-turn-helix transcriptional regulator [Amycolatopsis sp. MtRt-6]|uniref:helix-turn-helix domain-containing protein n=1 Tax=Amycolatopsis sp. MtRt-6 TaxID=2792782 RepID=UPI001A8DC02F|nr:helix-turn-helix transcriptional regulator [Amycolatopsis sp. MtRt-6]